MYDDLLFVSQEENAKKTIKRIWGKAPLFVCVMANTEVGKIEGLSAAGANPTLTDFTPPADAEFVELGRCICIDGVPVTPEGIPTPAIITRASVRLADIPFLAVNAGLNVLPRIPYIGVCGKPGGDIRGIKAVEEPEKTYVNAKMVGRTLAKICDFLVVGESVPGGTTTTLATLTGLGYDAFGRVSSSMPDNPHAMKEKIVRQAMKNLLDKDVFSVLSHMGDPMIPVHAGLCAGAGKTIPVLLAGGTQMAAVLSVIKETEEGIMDDLLIATTGWIAKDKTSDLPGLIKEISSIPIIATRLSFASSEYEGLQAYEKGFVKEGVGAGGSAVAAYIKSEGRIDSGKIQCEVERIYRELIS